MSSTLTFDEVIRLYRVIVRESGGEYGFVSEGTLRYIVDSIRSMRGDVFSKAAFVIGEIASKHPLVIGNKRLAFALGALLLRKEGWEVSVNIGQVGFAKLLSDGLGCRKASVGHLPMS